MDHKAKLKLARKMMTRREIENRVPPFQGDAWTERRRFRMKYPESIVETLADGKGSLVHQEEGMVIREVGKEKTSDLKWHRKIWNRIIK